MKTILFLLVLVGIAIVANSEASKKKIKKDVSFDKGEKKSVDDDRSVKNVKNKYNSKTDSSRVMPGISIPGVPSSPNTNTLSLLDLIQSLNPDLFKTLDCILDKLGLNPDECQLLGLDSNSRGDTLGRFGREDRCDDCNPDSDNPLSSMSNICPILNNVTSYISCYLGKLEILDCLDYVVECFTALTDCLEEYLKQLYANDITCDDLLTFLEYDLGLVLNILYKLLGGSFWLNSPSEIPDFCFELGLFK
ncbi:uncharacterized protein [Centruroides vittatus]|uniref:uncharacterized protein n=1 Tax=Centruroides vittatus TaxID=120091 RepID=UPI003510BAC7